MKTFIAAFLSLTTLATTAQPAQPSQTSQTVRPNTTDFIMECMKSPGELPHKEMILWLPTSYWDIVGGQLNLPPESITTIAREMGQYMMFCVVDYTVQGQQISFRSADDIRPTIKMIDSSKHVYLPLADKDISPIATQILERFQPMMAKMLGQFGEGMHIFMFDATGSDGKPAFDVYKPNRFVLTWDDASAKWSLPFASVLPPKYCPVDKEVMKGNWNYCPIHGAKLSTAQN